ncbi:MAG: glycosyltransferase [Cyanobacteriota bacterium]|jgi:glycosyltransferase involved in cell wall biosynthesis
MNILAVLATRNEVLHIKRCIECLIENGFEVALVDHGSTDGTREVAETYLGNGLLHIDEIPWEGSFSLEKQLIAKAKIFEQSSHQWVAHFDADEWPMPAAAFTRLVDMASEANSRGYNAINFNEFVFIPEPGRDYCHSDHGSIMSNYYFFQPSYPRLQRMWRRESMLSSLEHGGHILSGRSVNIFPVDAALRHYIILSQEHALAKYVGRIFADTDLKRGWHQNRMTITESKIKNFFQSYSNYCKQIKVLQNPISRDFDISSPQKYHFWDWYNYAAEREFEIQAKESELLQ